MPFVTSRNSGVSTGINALAKAFIGDPDAEAKLRNQGIQNETEFLRQKQLQEQTLTEGVRRNNIQAQAASNQAQADQRRNDLEEAKAMGDLFTQFAPQPVAEGMQGPPAPGKDFDLNTEAPNILAHLFRGGGDAGNLSALSLMGGQDDNDLGRIMTASGNAIGANDFGFPKITFTKPFNSS